MDISKEVRMTLLLSCWCTRPQNLSYLSHLNIGLGLSVSLVRQYFSTGSNGISELTYVQGGADIKENGALNAGLLDQVRNILLHQLLPIANLLLYYQRGALRWVQRYIHLFGGDKRWRPIPWLRASSGPQLHRKLAKSRFGVNQPVRDRLSSRYNSF